MTSLIPELRTDRNGKTVIRWVKSHPTDESGSGSMPAPELSSRPATDHAAGITDRLTDLADQTGYYFEPFLLESPSSTLAYVHEALTTIEDAYFPDQILSLMNVRVEPSTIEAYIHLHDNHEKPIQLWDEVEYLRGAILSGTNPPEGYDRNDPDRVAAVTSLIRFLRGTNRSIFADVVEDRPRVNRGNVDRSELISCQIKNPHIADYITENPDRVDAVIRIATDHPEQLRDRDRAGIEVVMQEARNWTPVSEGVL